MNFMNQISSGTAFVVGIAAGVPSFVAASINGETMSTMGGIALGVIGLGWAIYRSSNDQRFNTILSRLDRAEEEAEKYRIELTNANDENIKIKKDRSEVVANYELLKKRLAVHVCPVAADPNHKCTLPDLLNITL